MPFVSFAERYGMKVGFEKGFQQGFQEGFEKGYKKGLVVRQSSIVRRAPISFLDREEVTEVQ